MTCQICAFAPMSSTMEAAALLALVASAALMGPSLAVAADLTDGRLVAVNVDGLRMPRRLQAVWDPDRGLRGAAREFLDIALGSNTAVHSR